MRNLVVYFITLALLCSCDGEEEVKHLPPVFKSCTPADGEVDVSVESSIEVVFDEVISLADNHGITINEQAAEVNASLTKLMFTQELDGQTTYEVNIPAGAVINSFGVPTQEAVNFSFTTEETNFELDDLVTENPMTQTVDVYNFLKENYGNKILSATQSNVAWNINEAEWVKYHTGKYPAMATFDYIFLGYSPANWIDYSDISFIEDWWSNNGIVAAGWHWMVPPDQDETDPGNYVYSTSTTFKASNVVIDGTWENAFAKADLNELAGYLKLLQDKNIPVIWRPLHEASGNINTGGSAWFWWGNSGAEAYKELWHFVFNYFKDAGINNLIWVWTTQIGDETFYPGDAYVDIIGRDIYNNSNAEDIASQFKSIRKTYSNKMVTLSEMGSVANISDQWSSGAKWSYFMPWYDYERTNDVNSAAFIETSHEHANAAWWQNVMLQDYVLSRDEMPDLK